MMRALRFTPPKNSFASSSPQAANRQAACVAVVPNSGLAMPHRSYHCGSVRSRIDFGRRSSADLIRVDDQHAGPRREAVPHAVRRLARSPEMHSACGELYGRNKPCRSSRSVLRISLFQNKSHRGRSRSAMIACSQADRFGRLGVELRPHDDAGLLGEVREDRLGKLLIERRVHDDFIRRVGSAAAAANDASPSTTVARIRPKSAADVMTFLRAADKSRCRLPATLIHSREDSIQEYLTQSASAGSRSILSQRR